MLDVNDEKYCKVVCLDINENKENHLFKSLCNKYKDILNKYLLDPIRNYNSGDCLVYALPDSNNSYLMFVHIDDTTDRSAAYGLYEAYTNIITLCTSIGINNIEFPNKMSNSLSSTTDDELFNRRFTNRINRYNLSYTK